MLEVLKKKKDRKKKKTGHPLLLFLPSQTHPDQFPCVKHEARPCSGTLSAWPPWLDGCLVFDLGFHHFSWWQITGQRAAQFQWTVNTLEDRKSSMHWLWAFKKVHKMCRCYFKAYAKKTCKMCTERSSVTLNEYLCHIKHLPEKVMGTDFPSNVLFFFF